MRGRVSGILLFWVSKGIGRILAPGLHTEKGLLRAIAKDRAKGPARPPRRLRERIEFREEVRDGTRTFVVAPTGGATGATKLLYLHGGAFVLDLQRIQWSLIAALLRETGAEITIPIYPLAPESTSEETISSVLSTYRAMVAERGSLDVVITGDSAGGALALLIAQALRDEGEDQPAALVLFSPVLDATASGPDQPSLERRDPSLSIALVHNAIRLWAPSLSPADPSISALFAEQRGLAPTLVFSGDREILDSDARRLVALNPEVDHRSYAEMAHVFQIGGGKEARHSLREVAAFIRHHVRNRG